MSMPRFTAAEAVYKSGRSYAQRPVEAPVNDYGQTVIPQQFAQCISRTMCTGLVMWCRDYCCRFDHTLFRSLWYVCGACVGVWQDDEPDPCVPQL